MNLEGMASSQSFCVLPAWLFPLGALSKHKMDVSLRGLMGGVSYATFHIQQETWDLPNWLRP